MADLRAAAQQALEAWDTRAGIDAASRAFDALRAALAQQTEPVQSAAWVDAYDMIDRFLRNNLRDDDYAEYSAALDSLYTAPPQQAEPTRSQKLADAGFSRRPGLWALKAREALELIATPQRPDGTWNRDRAACRQLAAEALGRYDDE